MNVNAFYFEYFNQTAGFSPVKNTNVLFDFNNRSTKQIEYKLDYSSSDSTVVKLISRFIDQIFISYDIKTIIANELNNKFISLANKWKEETYQLSSITDICTHPAYQQIIGMGKSVLSLIINELKNSPDHWFWALKSITGEDPVPDNDRGNINKMTKAWIEWASKKGM